MQAEPAEDLASIVGARVRLVRADRKLSQNELARLCGMNQAHVSHFENGSREPLVRSLMRLASALGCSMDYLVGLSDELAPRKAAK